MSMKISSKTRGWLLLGIVIIVLVILLYFLFNDKLEVQVPVANEPPATEGERPTTSSEPVPEVPTVQEATAQPPLDDRARNEIQLEKMASAFVERWISLSNQDNFSNLAILKNQMTNKMIKWTDEYIQQQIASSSNNDIYMGVQGQALVANGILENEAATSLDIDVKIRGKETIASSLNEPKVFYQDYKVSMVKSGGVWLVDKLTWGNRQYQE